MRFDKHSIGVKLWLYFALFAAVILVLLWLLQIVFLQGFYEDMKIRDIEEVAVALSEAYGQSDFEQTVDKMTYRNAILAVVADTSGNVIYSSDEHGSGGPGKNSRFGGTKGGYSGARPLPDNFDEFLARLESAGDHVSFTMKDDMLSGKFLIYGMKLSDAVLYIRAPLDPINATTAILRTQLIYVTVVALVMSFIIAVFISRKFSKPVAGISQQAGELAKGNFDVTFDKGFCSEIDELAATLDHTAKELSKVEKLRRELIANISHDLRTPLTMVKAYTEMIRDISGENRAKREEHLTVIAAETERLIALVNDILDLSAIQSENVEPQFDNVNLSDTVKSVVSRFEPLAEHEGYKIQTAVEPDQYVFADRQKITQVLYNLIGNAISNLGKDKLVTVRLDDLGSGVRFEVSDHGEGIPEEELPLIWERYYKAKEHRRTKAGTGLGLSIVKGILLLHDARFGVTSAVGKGSTFWFELKK